MTNDLAPKVRKAWIGCDINASDHWPVFVEFGLQRPVLALPAAR